MVEDRDQIIKALNCSLSYALADLQTFLSTNSRLKQKFPYVYPTLYKEKKQTQMLFDSRNILTNKRPFVSLIR